MLHHETYDDAAIREMIRATRDYIVIIEPNALNPFTVLAGILRKEERKSLLFTRKFVSSKMMKYSLEEVTVFSCGFVPPFSMPEWAWKIVKLLDRRIPLVGLENIFIFRKKHGS